MASQKTLIKIIALFALLSIQFGIVYSQSENLKELQLKMEAKEHSDYDVLIYYTLSAKCDHCVTIEEELKQVAYSYLQSERHLSNDPDKRPVIFAKIEYNALNSGIFLLSNYTSVPILALAQPSIVKTARENKRIEYPSKLEWKISAMDFFDAGKLIEHINKITNSNVELKYTFARVMIGNIIIILGAGCVLFFLKGYIAMIIQNKAMWMIGTVVIFVLCIGGTAFNMIHSPPTFKYSQSGGFGAEEYFRRDQRSQYYGEGYLSSMLMLSIGVILVLFTLLNKLSVKNDVKKELIGVLLVILLFALVMILSYVFGIKSHHYTPSLFPPDHYVSGSYSNDQGTNI